MESVFIFFNGPCCKIQIIYIKVRLEIEPLIRETENIQLSARERWEFSLSLVFRSLRNGFQLNVIFNESGLSEF